MNKNKATQTKRVLTGSRYKDELEMISKVEQVNKELLSENAGLIGQINALEKKLNSLQNKIPNKKKSKKTSEGSVATYKDKSLMQTLKTYREKLAKALDLNSRLSENLVTERSKSRLLSRVEGATEDMGVISTIRSTSLKDEKKEKKKESKKQLLCNKCYGEVN